ncbi:Na+/H+ antiporter subunit D [Aeromicrobium choanae]|uniref:Multisubunit sodium/proton antiporter, MrpD subunit n=1 Tax=Aeromicrobium choanae TaxID=1736691 RepID=A0A1T4YWC4_9ACTN|nr:Na+/H+ antiporter subunit D [Aeromicrobium choanae]SKB06082.1 multisubunit sodium/proton antiporter, MrpD subunit [Aeromicrobium choanae]
MSDGLLDQLVLAPVILPLLGAGLCLAFGRFAGAQRVISILTLLAVVASASVLLVRADQHGPQAFNVGGWPAEIGISLVADRLSSLLLLISTIVTLCVLLYSIGQGIVEFGRDTPLSVFYPTFLVLSAGVSNAFLSADLFNLFVGFEILLASSYVLITLGGTEARVRSGTIYIIVSLASSALFLIAVACVYAATGTINFAQLALRMQDLPDSTATMLQLLLLLTFAVKAAVFPLSAWLPDSYPTAPAPVTAVFAGLLTKVGVYAMLRTQTLLFPTHELRTLLLWASVLTMVVGIMGAVAQSDIKRVLSFTLVSHIGYMLFGIALGSELGVAGAIFYIIHHITVQTTLFLVAGLVEYRSGTTNLDRLGGLARYAPVLSVMFFVPAMNLAGIPPFSGFLGKLALLEAGVEAGDSLALLGVGAAVATSLLTLYAVAKIWNRAFWQPLADPEDDTPVPFGPAGLGGSLHGRSGVSTATQRETTWKTDTEGERLPSRMALPTIALGLVTIALTVFAGPLFAMTERAADELHERTPYIEAVLGDG